MIKRRHISKYFFNAVMTPYYNCNKKSTDQSLNLIPVMDD
jgi:hypothetical protein